MGQLELNVLEYVWRLGAGDAKGIQQHLDRQRRISLSTVQSTLERLARKKLLMRKKSSHAYVYEPAVTRQNLIARMIRDVVSELSNGNLEPAMSGLIDLADPLDDRTLDRLEQMIVERRRQLPVNE